MVPAPADRAGLWRFAHGTDSSYGSLHADGAVLCDSRSSAGDRRFAEFDLFMATLSLNVLATKFVPKGSPGSFFHGLIPFTLTVVG